MGYRDKGFFRRQFPRRRFDRVISVLARGEYVLVTAGEIGEGGLSFQLDKPLAVGLQIVINLGIPGGDFVSLRGEVKSTRPAGGGHIHGVAFSNILFAHKRQIRGFVSARGDGESLV